MKAEKTFIAVVPNAPFFLRGKLSFSYYNTKQTFSCLLKMAGYAKVYIAYKQVVRNIKKTWKVTKPTRQTQVLTL